MDVFGEALTDFYNGRLKEKLFLHTSYGETEEMPVEVFFREEADLTPLESVALRYCKGQVLDVGAGAGALTKILIDRGLHCTAVEISESACQIMKADGIKNVRCEDILNSTPEPQYDTVLLLMNGLGLAGKLDKLSHFLLHMKGFLKPDGQLICDSSDISYLYDESYPKPMNHYYGEIRYQYEYKGKKGSWFDWLYVDLETLQPIALALGFEVKLLFKDQSDQYLLQLTLAEKN